MYSSCCHPMSKVNLGVNKREHIVVLNAAFYIVHHAGRNLRWKQIRNLS